MNFNDLLLRAAIDPGRTLGEFAKLGMQLTPGGSGLLAVGQGLGDASALAAAKLKAKQDELAGMVDTGPLPEVKTPMGVSPAAYPGEEVANPGAGLQMGIAQGRDAQMAAEAAARKAASEKAYYAAQGMQYYAPGIGFKGEFAKPGAQMSAFGQPYKAVSGGYGSPVAEGGEAEAELYNNANLRQLGREARLAAGEQALAQARLGPVEAAKINALSRTQYRVDPVRQAAFGLGRKVTAARAAALAKAWSDAEGDPTKYAQAKARIDELYPMDYEQLLANSLGERAAQQGLAFTGGE